MSDKASDLESLTEKLAEELDSRATSVLDEWDWQEPIRRIRDGPIYKAVQAVEKHYGGKLPVKKGGWQPWKAWRTMLLIADEGKGPKDEYEKTHKYCRAVEALRDWAASEIPGRSVAWTSTLTKSQQPWDGGNLMEASGRRLSDETGQNVAEQPDDHDPVEEVLKGQPLSIYLFLRNRKHWTHYDTLRNKGDFWRKPSPDDSAINRALRRLRQELAEIDVSAVSLSIETKHKRTKLDK
jgi:hypothetical protein